MLFDYSGPQSTLVRRRHIEQLQRQIKHHGAGPKAKRLRARLRKLITKQVSGK